MFILLVFQHLTREKSQRVLIYLVEYWVLNELIDQVYRPLFPGLVTNVLITDQLVRRNKS